MADTGRLDELQRKFDENPRRFFAPLANEYRKAGSIERSIELCEEYLPQHPGHMSGYIVYGQALFDGGRHPEAVKAFQEALAVDPDNIIALKHLGDIAKYAGDRDAAVVWYRRVIELDPKNDDIVAYLAGQSSDEAPQPSRAPAAPPPYQVVHPEPVPDSGTVALSDLMEQPDVPLAAAPTFSLSEIGLEQLGEPGNLEVGVEEARAAFDQMLADRLPAEAGNLSWTDDGETKEAAGRSSVEASETGGVAESVSLLPLITEFTMSVAPPQAHQEQPVTKLSSTEPLVEPPVLAEAPVADSPRAEPPREEIPVFEPWIPEHKAAADTELEVPFVTETMADLYLQQGFTAQALDVYRRLAATGDDPKVLEKIQRLELSIVQQEAISVKQDASSAFVSSSPAAPKVTVRDFFARIGARRPSRVTEAPQTSPGGLGTLFDPTRVDDADARAASVLAGAYTAAR